MQVQLFETRKVFKHLLFASTIALVVLVSVCGFFRVKSPSDLVAYKGMWRECHPLWREFALRRVNSGDSAAELLERFPPDAYELSGATEIYTYYRLPVNKNGIPFTGLSVATRTGKLVGAEAWSCTWRFTFF